ncbi:MAG: hypothetical protein R3C14_12000 [Caldilineaceae bacterium]
MQLKDLLLKLLLALLLALLLLILAQTVQAAPEFDRLTVTVLQF